MLKRPVSWDERKRQQVIRERGVDIVRIARMLENPGDLLLRLDRRADYGEYRYQAVGRLDDEVYFLVYAKRRGHRHLITGWKLNDAGQRRYQNRLRRRP